MRSGSLRLLIFFLVSSSLLAALHVYLYRRWVRDVVSSPRARNAGKAVLGTLAFLAVLVRPVHYVFGNLFSRPFALVALSWMGVALGASLLLGALDLLRGIVALATRWGSGPVSPERRLFLSRAIAGGSVLASGITAGYGLTWALGPPQLSELNVQLPNLPRALSGLTLLQLSDIHIGELLQEKYMVELIERCNALRPDAVVITGDLVDGTVPRLSRYVAPLQRLRSRYGTFFITGNHDYYSGADEWCEALSGLGLTVLRNRRVVLGDSGASLDLAGVDDWGARRGGRGYDLEEALAGRDPSRALVLLSHQPANVEQAVARGVGLQLSGHTHGGQIFPLTAMVGLAWPYPRGRYTLGASTLYVHRGTGFVGPPMRVGSPPELALITLT
jgi:predicted MPP superfamily phosphohydrolase